MKTLLEAIKKHPQVFIDTCRARANTTPSVINKSNHLQIAIAIENSLWYHVERLLADCTYHKPLEGVVFCLKLDYDMSEKGKIIKLFENGDLV